MLDTSVAILVRDADPMAIERLTELRDTFVISIVTRVELEGGVWRSPDDVQIRRANLELFLASIEVVEFDHQSADAYRLILGAAGYSRRKVLDRMIGAQALAHRLPLVTLNRADFADIPGLELLAW